MDISPAQDLLRQAGLISPLPAAFPSVKILDNAAGLGFTTSRLLSWLNDEDRRKISVVCADIEPTMIELARNEFAKEGWSGIETKVADPQKLPFDNNTFDFVLTNFGLRCMSDPSLIVRETHRVLKPGGKTGFTFWKSVEWFEPFLASESTSPESASSESTANFLKFKAAFDSRGWTDPLEIESNLTAMGFKDIHVFPILIMAVCNNAKCFVESLKIYIPHIFGDGTEERMIKVLEDKHGAGKFPVNDWVTVLVTATRA